MKRSQVIKNIQRRILTWYRHAGRDLPWRKTKDPYEIVVSEVMLQQTQVDRVIPKYHAWVKKFPAIQHVAAASLQDVLTLWSGLGYNSRGLRLRTMAQIVMRDRQGKIPTTVEELKSLPGIGPYTAAAVATFAYKQRVPVIDTNIRRVIGRIFFGVNGAPTEKKLQAKVEEVLPTVRPDLWNHALMDLGATVCIARQPKCTECPVQELCRAYPKILSAPKKSNVVRTPKFETTDRFWRGRILATLLMQPALPLQELHRRLRKIGKIEISRTRRLINVLASEGLIQQRRNTYAVSS